MWIGISAVARWTRKGIVEHVYELLSFLLPFVIYARSVSSEPASWDTAELQAVPYLLGIAHPTGFPFYTLLGWAYSHIFIFGTVAYRLNIFSSFWVATACYGGYLVSRELNVPKFIALLAALWFGVGSIVWTHASRAEVHDLALALSVGAILYGIKFLRTCAIKYYFATTLFFGLALATHPIAIWLIPGLLVLYFLAHRKPSFREVSISLGIIVVCLSLYLYLPIRSAYVMGHHGDPTARLIGTTGSILLNYNDPSTWSGFIKEISGSQFHVSGAVWAAWNPSQIQNYLWQWLTSLNTEYGAFGIILAFLGLQRLWRYNRRFTTVLVLLGTMAIPFSYAFAAVEGDPDRYRLLSFWLIPILMSGASISLGAEKAWARKAIVATLMLLWGAQTFYNNQGIFNNRNNMGGRALISEAVKRIPQGSIVVTTWLDAASLAYGAYVDGSFPDRTVISAQPGQYARMYPQWLREAPIYVIAPPGNAALGIGLKSLGLLDGSHVLYQVLQRS